MEKNVEQWLSLRDKKTKRYVKQIKLDSDCVSRLDLNEYFLIIQNMLDKIDLKFTTLIKSSITYHFQGLIDIYNGEMLDPSYVKYELQSELLKLIDAIIFDLNTKICDPYDINNTINSINNIYNILHIIFEKIHGGTSNQEIIVEEKIDMMINLHNQYLSYLESQYDYQKMCLSFTIPQTYIHALQISCAIDKTNFNINGIKSLYIETKKIIGEIKNEPHDKILNTGGANSGLII